MIVVACAKNVDFSPESPEIFLGSDLKLPGLEFLHRAWILDSYLFNLFSMADMSMMNAERTITVEGDLTKSEEALKLIMEKLRACYENDMQSAYQVISMFLNSQIYLQFVFAGFGWLLPSDL